MYEAIGNLKAVAKDFKTGAAIISFSVDRCSDEVISELENKKLRITAKQYRERRSLDSNAYMWVLTDKIAQVHNITADEVHRKHIYEYRKADLIDDQPIVVTVKAHVDMSRIDGYWKHYMDSDDGKWVSYYKLKSTRDFDTREMSHFLKTMVIPDALELGIEVATPDELLKMEKLYEEHLEKLERMREECRKSRENRRS